MKIPVLLAMLCLMSTSAICFADSYEYEYYQVYFDGYDSSHKPLLEPVSFTYLSPFLIIQPEVFTADTSSYYDPVSKTWFDDPLIVHANPLTGGISVNGKALAAGGSGDPAWFTVGNHTNNAPQYTRSLNVIDVPSAPVSLAPEPSTFALLGTGLAGFAGFARRRFR